MHVFLYFPTDFLGFKILIFSPFLLKQDTHMVAAFLIGDSGVLSLHNFFADIIENKRHQSAFLTFHCIYLIHVGIHVDIKQRHPAAYGSKFNPHVFQLLDPCLHINGAVHNRFQGFGADHLSILTVIL